VHTTGEVRFTDDDRDVAYVAPGARMTIEEEVSGQPDRRVEYHRTSDGIQRSFFRDGRAVQPDAEDEAWIRRALLHPIRESGVNAAPRTARIYRRGGVDAVLDEIRQIGSDGGKSRYYTALLRLPLRAGETARVLRDAGERIGSDGDKQRTLAVLLERRSIAPEEMEAMLDAAARIGSDGDKSRLLIQALTRDPLADPEVREAFFRTAGGIGSDGDKSRVLRIPLRQGSAGEPEVIADSFEGKPLAGKPNDLAEDRRHHARLDREVVDAVWAAVEALLPD